MTVIESDIQKENKLKLFFNNLFIWIFQNLISYWFFYIMKRNLRYLISKEHYTYLKPLFTHNYFTFGDEEKIENRTYIPEFTVNEIDFYLSVLDKISLYERVFIKDMLAALYPKCFNFDNNKPDISIYYDGFDIGRYVLYSKFFNKKKYYKIIDRTTDTITLDNNKTINILPYNFLFYLPISHSIKRKKIIKKILK